MLEQAYDQCQFAEGDRARELAVKIGLTPKQVYNWYVRLILLVLLLFLFRKNKDVVFASASSYPTYFGSISAIFLLIGQCRLGGLFSRLFSFVAISAWFVSIWGCL